MWSTIRSITSSTNGGFASNEPCNKQNKQNKQISKTPKQAKSKIRKNNPNTPRAGGGREEERGVQNKGWRLDVVPKVVLDGGRDIL